MRQLDENIWVIDHPFSMAGVRVGTRTTVVRLQDGGLFLHSPGPLSVTLSQQLEKLGPVRWIVAPNLFHHLFVAENAKAYQAAEVFLAPGLASKRKELPFNEELSDEAPAAWRGQIDQLVLGGAPRLSEVVFLHRASRTLLMTDLAFNFHDADSLPTRLFLKLNGTHGRFGPSRLIRFLVRDREAMRSGLRRVLEWDFDRAILAHGDVVEKDAKPLLRDAFAWLLEA